jgi:hypothetical protein
MEQFETFKEKLLNYLYTEKSMEKHDIEVMKQLSREEKIESDLMIANLTIAKTDNESYILNAESNYSKLRSGDKVILRSVGNDKGIKATVIDATIDTITITSDKELDSSLVYDLETDSPNLLDSLIGCLEGILPATTGAAFLRMLSGEEAVYAEDFLKLDPSSIVGFEKTYALLNEEQKRAVTSMLEYYPIHVLQGPPGTGKTLVLASTAIASSINDREVVIIANTHQAVNNALLKIRQLNKNIPLLKVGELLKAEELGNDIIKCPKFTDYNEFSRKNRRKKKYGYVVGMTIWSAISNLGLRTHSHFRPYIALVDEASLMPLTYASILGKCASSICFFGDSRQMPPIFRTELEGNVLSESILDYCATKVDGVPVCVLPETHRMNKDITKLVSKSFYEPYGISLKSATNIEGNTFSSAYLEKRGLTDSIVFMDTDISTPNCQEENEGEANAIIEIVKSLLDEGNKPTDIAVITPYRKQVRLLRSKAHEVIPYDNCPLIDTVERLQGQDVCCIIISFASSDKDYINEVHDFIFNPNRLNVMISRAKTKVILFGCEQIQNELKEKTFLI